jgi:hypothetical protein
MSQLHLPDELKGYLLHKQANFEPTEKRMILASARGNCKVGDLVNSMRQCYGEQADIQVNRPYFVPNEAKTFCNYRKTKNHVEADCWKKRKK